MLRILPVVVLTAPLVIGGCTMARGELKVGDPAPPFALQGTDGKIHSLEEFKGKKAVVVAWFPKAFTSG